MIVVFLFRVLDQKYIQGRWAGWAESLVVQVSTYSWESWKEQPGDYYQSQPCEVCTELLLSTLSQKFPQDQPLLLYSICHLLLLHAFVPPKEEGPLGHFYVCTWVTIKHWFYSVVCFSTYNFLRSMPKLCGICRLVKIFCLLFMGGKFLTFLSDLDSFCFFLLLVEW